MCRTATLVLALVTLALCGASAAQGSTPAKVHGKAAAAAKEHPSRRATAVPGRQHADAAQTRTRHQTSTTRKPTPNAAGRAAGLAIRRQLRQKPAARRTVALRGEHAKAMAQPERSMARPRSQRLSIAQREEREAPAMGVASAATILLLPNLANRTEPQVTSSEPDQGAEAPAANAEPEVAWLRVPPLTMPAPLRGSRESLERQNARLDAEGLERIEDEADLADRIEHKLLVPIPASHALTVNAGLPAAHRFCRPWTALFLADLARAHDAEFHRPLEVSSAVRTVAYQKRLMGINGNAAAAEGDIVSPHLTGATIDIAKSGLSRAEITWMRRRLLALETAGKIDVEEEFQQACFHITVYKSYAPPQAPRPATQARSGSAANKRHKAPVAAAAADTQGL
jgi:hypothetical protein